MVPRPHSSLLALPILLLRALVHGSGSYPVGWLRGQSEAGISLQRCLWLPWSILSGFLMVNNRNKLCPTGKENFGGSNHLLSQMLERAEGKVGQAGLGHPGNWLQWPDSSENCCPLEWTADSFSPAGCSAQGSALRGKGWPGLSFRLPVATDKWETWMPEPEDSMHWDRDGFSKKNQNVLTRYWGSCFR